MTRKSMVAVGRRSNGRWCSGGVQVSLRRRRPFQLMVLRRLRELKKIVPATSRRGSAAAAGGADVDALLRRAAEYICALELKVAVLRKLSAIYGA
ncbi:uncharacterized protein LOC107304799 [Oryza brachyantha]|uniref:uncharacterized protein LOC107304799 n=1 Tax=Oryza brachyantha TaxID=4533 RepID=UPI001ADD1BFB|nr:uncharacterized protein LOC107304799 [Oryza brachyantha]